MSKAYPKLSVSQRKLLVRTRDKDLLQVFGGYPRSLLRRWKDEARHEFPGEAVQADLVDQERKRSLSAMKKEKDFLLDEREKLRKETDAIRKLIGAKGYREISIRSRSKKREATAVALASDWHCEERVSLEETNGLNEYSLDIFDKRADLYFVNLAKLINKEQQATTIRNAVLWLGGDFVSGNIHEELMETNQLGPVKAAIHCQKKITGGIHYLLANTDVQWKIVCSVGNHERITHKKRIKTSIENSLATYMYYALALQFEDDPRVTFRLPNAYHTYVDVHGFTCRFHHGDAIRFGGGVGGIMIPVKKKIARWNTSRRADYDFMGHFHQFFDGGYVVVNGSLIGHSAYAVEIAAEFERPKQAFTLIDSRHGKTGSFPIIVTES